MNAINQLYEQSYRLEGTRTVPLTLHLVPLSPTPPTTSVADLDHFDTDPNHAFQFDMNLTLIRI